VVRVLLALPLGAALVWGAAALWLDGPAARRPAGALAATWVLLGFTLLVLLRPRRRGVLLFALAFAVLLAWWLSLAPRNDRDWLPDVARPATAEIEDGRVTVRNLRHFEYRSETEYTERWEERRFDLARVVGLDLFLSYWGSPAIAHTILSFEIEGQPPLAVSIETRKEKGESYSALRGFFRQYELYYVVADERDVIRLRTDQRGEDVYLYRLRVPAERVQALLLAYLREIDRLAREPRWYNALTHNCTTTIRLHAQQTGVRNPWNWRLLANGWVDELLYMRGTLVDGGLPFPELKARSAISARARALGDAPDFSRRLREGLPARAYGGGAASR
jgi:hypothetical protein